MRYCDNCGKKITSFQAYTVKDQGGFKLKVCRDCKRNIYEKRSSEDFVHHAESFEHYDENFQVKQKRVQKDGRPLGVTLIIIWNVLQILFSLSIIPSMLRLFTYDSYNSYYSVTFLSGFLPQYFEHYPIFIVLQFIILMMFIFVTIGLKNGSRWSPKAEIVVVLIHGIISGTFAFIIAILIVIYLKQPGVKAYFEKN